MAFTIGGVKIRIGADLKALERDLKKAGRSLKKSGRELQRLGDDMSRNVSLPLIAIGGAATKMASDFEESMNKVNVAFKGSSGSVVAFSKTTLNSFGISQSAALDMASTFGDMSTSMGLSEDRAARLSNSLVGLTGDLASFKNIGIDQAFNALSGVFTGETESLKKLGIVMTETNLAAFALEQGITKSIKSFTQSEKVLLRYRFIMSKTENAQGDFARTSDGAANQTRVFRESLKELGTELGQVLLPSYTSAVQKLNDMVKAYRELTPEQKKTTVEVAGTAAAIGPLLIATGKLRSAFGALLAGSGGLAGGLAKVTGAGVVLYGVFKNFDALKTVFSEIGRDIDVALPSWFKLRDVSFAFNKAIRTGIGLIGLLAKSAIDVARSMTTTWTALGDVISAAVNPFDDNTVSDAADRSADSIRASYAKLKRELEANAIDFINVVGFEDNPIELPKLGGVRGVGGSGGGAGGVEQTSLLPPDEIPKLEQAKALLSQVALIGKQRADYQIEQSEYIKEGLGVENTLLTEQKEALQGIADSMQIVAVTGSNSLDQLNEKLREMADEAASTKVVLDQTFSIESELASVGEALGSLFTGDLGASGFFNRILSLFGGFMKKIGVQMLALSKAGIALKTLFANPTAAAVAGVALIAAGSAIQNLANKSVPSLAIGTDYVNQDGLAYLHKGEKVVPADVVKGGYTGGGGFVQVGGRISGRDIIISGNNSRRAYNRIR